MIQSTTMKRHLGTVGATIAAAVVFGVPATLIPSAAHAVPIVGPGQISFSSASAGTTVIAGSFDATVDGILDNPGTSPPFNGVSLETFPLSVTYNFDVPYDLNSFFLQGEFGTNSISNAIQGFELQFFDDTDGGGAQVGALFQGQQTNPTALQLFDLSAENYLNVQSFSLFVVSVNGVGNRLFEPGRVEYAEIQFDGTASVIPDPDPDPDPDPATVSEPGPLTLVGLGLVMLGLLRRRRNAA